MRTAVCAVFLPWLLVANLQAQEVRGRLEGRVLDSQGSPILAVDIVVRGPALQGTRDAVTNEDGFFRLLWLPVGSYTVEIQRLGYQTLVLRAVEIRLGRTTTMGEIRLDEAPIEVEPVVAVAEGELIDPASTTGGFNLTPELYETLPVERDYQSMAALVPQVNTSYLGGAEALNMSGATWMENKFFIEGVDVSDPYLGDGGTNLPYNFVKEIEVKTGGYEAEYRSSLGGIVNVVTYSGGNEFSGRLLGFYSNNSFDATPRSGPLEVSSGDYARYDFGGALGGPIARDRLWFFAAYNPSFVVEDVPLQDFGVFQDKITKQLFAGKLTWQPGPRTNIYFSAFGDPTRRDRVAGTSLTLETPDWALRTWTYGGVSLMLNGTHFLSDKVMLEASISRVAQTFKLEAATEGGRTGTIEFYDFVNGGVSGAVVPFDDRSSRTAIRAGATLMVGRHLVKGGIEYVDNKYESKGWGFGPVDPGGELKGQLLRFNDTTWTLIDLWLVGSVHNRVPSVFVRDGWQVTDRLRVNAGLRWDGNYLIGSDGEVALDILDQWQPRVGFIFLPGRIGSQRIYGSFGRFYQDLHLGLSSLYHNEQAYEVDTEYDHDPRVDRSGADTVLNSQGTIYREEGDLEGQYYDEFTLGYERQVGRNLRLGVRGIYRRLGQGIEDGYIEELDQQYYGNPGQGIMSDYPPMERTYAALELTAQQTLGEQLNVVASYVLSRAHGNQPGLYNADQGQGYMPNATWHFQSPELLEKATGLLPHDRTHALKLIGSYRMDFGLDVGASFCWQSGTPLSRLGGSPYTVFLSERGSAGRMPSLWDLNFRFAYDVSRLTGASWGSRLILDVFHVGNPREAVDFDQQQFWTVDEEFNPADPNENYGESLKFQPPMTVRLGLEVSF